MIENVKRKEVVPVALSRGSQCVNSSAGTTVFHQRDFFDHRQSQTMATEIQKALSDEITKYQQLEKDKQKVIGLIKQLDVQLNENSAVKEVSFDSVFLIADLSDF